MGSTLVTGGTGTLGRAVVRELGGDAGEVRVLTRRAGGVPPPARSSIGDLSTGEGLAEAVDGVDAIVHCATTNGRGDVEATRRLVDAALRTGRSPHLIYISIVGVDCIDFPYYRAKLATERLIMGSGLPWTILRATQFHDLLTAVFAWQRWSPVGLAIKGVSFQPIDTRDVAPRLAALVTEGPSGRVRDIGGPEVIEMRELARRYDAARGRRRRIAAVRVPGKVAGQFAAGRHLTPDNAVGSITFQQFLADDA